MYTIEILNALRTLNRLDMERRRLTAGSPAAAEAEQHQSATRSRLPHSVLCFHDRLAARGQPSVVRLAGSSCSACHLKLPSGVLGEMATPGRYSACPNCIVYVWSGEPPVEEVAVAPKRPSRRAVYA